MSAFIECRQVVKAYKASGHEVVALRGIDFTMQRGEMTAIIGPSGAGKSSLMNLLGGLDRPTAGRVMVGETSVPELKGRRLAQYRLQRVGFVWQQVERNLLAHRTALGNVTLPMMLAGVNLLTRRRRALELLDSVGIAEHAHKAVGQLSGGQQQRVAIAVALANQPELLLADEPTGALDRRTAHGVMQLLAELRGRLNLTVLMVTHDMDMAADADRVLTLRDGALGQELSGEGDQGPVLRADGSLPLPEAARRQLMQAPRIAVEVRPEGVLLRPETDEDDDIPTQDPLPPARRRWWRLRR
ncbi:MAG: ABC transporter ATP-binding protein [Chloroflexi bacterium]|nr:ABC transporter ATP-binding protein [Chloroflexota bacterium]